MHLKKCRVCNHDLYNTPLFVLKNIPKSAQEFPTKKQLQKEKGVNLSIYQCSGCGLVQIINKPVSYYKEVIRAGISKEMQLFRERQFSQFVKKYNLLNKKIVEIGCGFGEYLSIMNKCNIRAYGIEYSQKAVDCCKKIGLNVSKQFVETESCKLKNAPFDAFFVMNYLEHVPNINSFLTGINNNLTDNAIGLVEVPTSDMILKKKLFSGFILDHLSYFTKDTLKYTLNSNGFDMLECKSIWKNYILSAVVKKRAKIDTTNFYKQKEIISKQLNDYISKFNNKNVVVWGAGHQSLVLITLAKIQNKIKFIVDSAKCKQNKFTPATHIPIYSPEKIDSSKVKAVIVMAGTYSDEIIKILLDKYNSKISIAVLNEDGLKIIK